MRPAPALLAASLALALQAEPDPAPLRAAGEGTAAKPARAKPFEELTPQSEAAIKRGTDWLLKAYNPDGGCGTDHGAESDIGCTAMAGMAFLSQGSTSTQGAQLKEVQRATQFLLDAIDRMPPDDITGRTDTQLQMKIGRHAHSFFAALFLAQSLGEERNPQRIQKPLRRLVFAIQSAQKEDGSWGDGSWAPVLGTVMGWESLRGAYFAGFRVKASLEKTERKLLDQMKDQAQGWMHELYKNASGIRVLHATGKADGPVAQRVTESVIRLIEKDSTPFTQAGGEEFLAFFLLNECLLQEGGERWRRWFPVMRDKLLQVQNKDGSWTGHHCITSRTFCTAAALLVLTSPNRYLPISAK